MLMTGCSLATNLQILLMHVSFTQVAGLLRSDLSSIERLPLRVGAILDGIVLHQV